MEESREKQRRLPGWGGPLAKPSHTLKHKPCLDTTILPFTAPFAPRLAGSKYAVYCLQTGAIRYDAPKGFPGGGPRPRSTMSRGFGEKGFWLW